MTFYGWPIIDRASWLSSSRFYIWTDISVPNDGYITEFHVYPYSTGTITFCVLRDIGTQYQIIHSEAFSAAAGGARSKTGLSLNVCSGDLIGYYFTAAVEENTYGSGTQANYLMYGPTSGVPPTTTDKSDWSAGSISIVSAGYTLETSISDYYVKATGGSDSNGGSSWSDAWATINKAATTVPDGTTVHIGFGTYNAEPANNDIAPVNAGAVGIKYSPETATTGGGTGSVIVEVN